MERRNVWVLFVCLICLLFLSIQASIVDNIQILTPRSESIWSIDRKNHQMNANVEFVFSKNNTRDITRIFFFSLNYREGSILQIGKIQQSISGKSQLISFSGSVNAHSIAKYNFPPSERDSSGNVGNFQLVVSDFVDSIKVYSNPFSIHIPEIQEIPYRFEIGRLLLYIVGPLVLVLVGICGIFILIRRMKEVKENEGGVAPLDIRLDEMRRNGINVDYALTQIQREAEGSYVQLDEFEPSEADLIDTKTNDDQNVDNEDDTHHPLDNHYYQKNADADRTTTFEIDDDDDETNEGHLN